MKPVCYSTREHANIVGFGFCFTAPHPVVTGACYRCVRAVDYLAIVVLVGVGGGRRGGAGGGGGGSADIRVRRHAACLAFGASDWNSYRLPPLISVIHTAIESDFTGTWIWICSCAFLPPTPTPHSPPAQRPMSALPKPLSSELLAF